MRVDLLLIMQIVIRQLNQEVSDRKKRKKKAPAAGCQFLILTAVCNSPCRAADPLVREQDIKGLVSLPGEQTAIRRAENLLWSGGTVSRGKANAHTSTQVSSNVCLFGSESSDRREH